MIIWKYHHLIIRNNNGNSHSNCGRDNRCVLVVFKMGKKLRKELMKEARELAKETYKKARSSKDDKVYSHPTEHDESDDLEMVKAIKEKE